MNLDHTFLSVVLCGACAVAQTQDGGAQGRGAQHREKTGGDAQMYRNASHGFTYKTPFGWVDRTKEMRELAADSSARGNSGTADADAKKAEVGPSAKASSGEVLLAVFERPPDAPGDSVNSAVLIASESAASYPGLKKAEDYLGPLTELATAKGFKAVGDPDVITIDAHELVRVDFSKTLPGKTTDDKLIMNQSTLVLLSKGQILSFTFIAGSEDEVDDLIEGLHFGAGR